ncbi:ShlB/FhaC/HecB family hemolysin secretion/activation protein [Collimonas sp.]|jgi:hemolysin activation/secretion protein|uniref:ShlB/FhaC/HecB family hemolysin secretion/activation protein n=1 Tax=Collimonas sp. TaxID=1963772 RepID=UPI0037BF599E
MKPFAKPFATTSQMPSRIHFLLAGAALLFSGVVSAQTNSGLLINSLPGPPAPNQKRDASARDIEVGNPKAAITGLAKQYSTIRLSGFESTFEGDVEGYRFVSQYFPLNITSIDWERISQEIFHHYIQRGQMIRVDLVMKGDQSALVDISELLVRSITVKNPGLRDQDVAALNRLLREYVKEGEPIDLKKFKEFLSVVDYRGNETITTKFLEVTEEGVDLNITIEPRHIVPFNKWAVMADNYGTKGFGLGRVGASYSAPLFSSGDNLGLQTVVSRGLQNISGRYDFPLPGVLPLRASIWTSILRYSATIDDIRQRGNATLAGVDLNYPYFFWSGAQLVGGLGYEYKRTKDEVVGIDTTNKTVQNLHVRINGGNLFNKQLSFFSDWTIGNLDLNGIRAPLQDVFTARTAGSFQKVNLGTDFIQPLGQQLYFSVRTRGQLSNKNLDSLEKMYFGGPSGVRAYDNNVSGDQGAQANVDFFYRLQATQWPTRIGGFFDYALGKTSHTPWEDEFAETESNTFHLNAIGLQADVSYQKVALNVMVARPVTTSSVNVDQKWRLWVNLKSTF